MVWNVGLLARASKAVEESVVAMLSVRMMATGREVARVGIAELLLQTGEENGTPDVLALKRHLHTICGVPRFRQRVLDQDGHMLPDDFKITAPGSVQLVLLEFAEPGLYNAATLMQALRQNQVWQMEAFLQSPQDPNWVIEGWPALHFAVEAGHRTAAQLWLEAGADVNHADMRNGTTALMLAVGNRNLDMIRLLLVSGADKDKATTAGATPLILAVSGGHLELVRLLLVSGADKDKATRAGVTPLFLAAAGGHLEMTRLLLDSGADKDKATTDGATPLFEASSGGHLEVTRLLLDSGADKDKATTEGATPLILAAQRGCLEVLRLLLDSGADKDKATTDGETPLFVAASLGHLEITRLLLDSGADRDNFV